MRKGEKEVLEWEKNAPLKLKLGRRKKMLGSNKILRVRTEWPAHTGRPFRALRECVIPREVI